MIPDEFEAFMASLDQDLYKALRINTKKVDPDRFPEPGLLGKPSPVSYTHLTLPTIVGV